MSVDNSILDTKARIPMPSQSCSCHEVNGLQITINGCCTVLGSKFKTRTQDSNTSHHVIGSMTADQIEPLKREFVTQYVDTDNTSPDNTASIAPIKFMAHPFLHCIITLVFDPVVPR